MKTILSFLFFIFISLSTFAQDKTIWSLELRGGSNYSDMNFGTSLLEPLLPLEDYEVNSSFGDGDFGYFIGAGLSGTFGKRWELITNIEFVTFSYDISAAVFDIPFDFNRVPREGVPNLFSGVLNYRFLNIETGVRYTFSDDRSEGFFIGAFISDMIHLDTDSDLSVRFEDFSIQKELSVEDFRSEVEYENIWFVGLNMGYNFRIADKISVGPIADFRYGLNPVVDKDVEDTIEPIAINLGVQAKWRLSK